MANETVVINFRGGIISPGDLFDLMEAAAAAHVTHVRFGSRQQMFLEIPSKHLKLFQQSCFEKGIRYHSAGEIAPNLISSYSAEGIFIADSWLSEGVYKDVFDMFDYEPKLKVNICDSDQTFVPFFSGNINWIASSQQHFWYLYIRFPGTNKLFCCPDLIYTNDIRNVSKAVEEIFSGDLSVVYSITKPDGNLLYQQVKKLIHPICKPLEQSLVLPSFQLPYYEGFNKYGNSYWLGIYRRNEMFAVPFLKRLAEVCLQTKIGELHATPWKSLIVKGINPSHRNIWDHLLGMYRINVRHAANELNWQVEDDNEDGLVLKRHIIRYFDKEDVRTYGLCFSVKTQSTSGIFGSVIIRRQLTNNRSRLKSLERYEILYTDNFNPNSSEYILFRDNIEKENLGVYLVSLCKMFYEGKSNIVLDKVIKPASVPTPEKAGEQLIYQCRHCLTQYNEDLGEAESNIAPNTSFESLPPAYCCPTCDAPKTDFEILYQGSIVLSK